MQPTTVALLSSGYIRTSPGPYLALQAFLFVLRARLSFFFAFFSFAFARFFSPAALARLSLRFAFLAAFFALPSFRSAFLHALLTREGGLPGGCAPGGGPPGGEPPGGGVPGGGEGGGGSPYWASTPTSFSPSPSETRR